MGEQLASQSVPTSDQVKLAVDRTFLAYERTLMAWIRTSVSLVTFGFALYKFFLYLYEQDPTRLGNHLLGARTFGRVLMGIGVAVLVAAVVQHGIQVRKLRATYGNVPQSFAMLVGTFFGLLGLAAFVVVMLEG